MSQSGRDPAIVGDLRFRFEVDILYMRPCGLFATWVLGQPSRFHNGLKIAQDPWRLVLVVK